MTMGIAAIKAEELAELLRLYVEATPATGKEENNESWQHPERTCLHCKHWEKLTSSYDSWFGNCHSPEVEQEESDDPCQTQTEIYTDKDFGCIHWSKKP